MFPQKTHHSLTRHSVLTALLLATLSSCSDGNGSATFSTGGNTAISATGGSFSSGGTISTGGQVFGTGGSGVVSTGGDSQVGSGGTGGGELGSGGAETGDNTATGGTGQFAFQPCPDSGACKILPLGDSITFGLQSQTQNPTPGGYRVELFRLAHSEGHNITFTGTQMQNGPNMVDGVEFPKKHAGISGQTVAQIAARIPSPDLSEMANIILLHAGTNDMYANPSAAPGELEKLLDKLIAEAPDSLIVVSSLIPFPAAAQATVTYNSQVKPLVDARSAAGSHIIFVDQFADFPVSELGDQVHPNDAGYVRMGKKWYDAIKNYL